ncbi:MAG TPA: TIGR03118 family protein [Saprospiraceae bacterium]|nr:TIGR03118 family protein [Saprospiraceae bacterium]
MSLLLVLFSSGCTDESVLPANDDLDNRGGTTAGGYFKQTNLVSDVAEYNANIIDPNLVNAWGIAIGSTGAFWISAAETELSVIYDDEGVTLRPPVTMEGDPTGQVFNATTDFMIPNEGAARFIFATEYGTVTAWRTGDIAPTFIDNSADSASYTGIEIASDGAANYLYLANVAKGTIDVYDGSWRNVTTMPFRDPNLPVGAKPFNIRLIDGRLFVTYVNNGGGLVNMFSTSGVFLKRFATGGPLSAPWGITKTPTDFALGGAMLIGNFGDGRINIYNAYGQYKGQLTNELGKPIEIDGLWALVFKEGSFNGTEDPDLYFTAGPDHEEHGLFGEIEPVERNTSGGSPTVPPDMVRK